MRSRADNGQQRGEKHQSMQRTENDDAEEHAEIVHAEYLRRSEGQHNDTDKLGERDALEHGGTHLGEGRTCSFSARAVIQHEAVRNVHAELDGDADSHDEIDRRDRVEIDAPQIHDANDINLDHGHGEHDQQRHGYVAQQRESDEEHRH